MTHKPLLFSLFCTILTIAVSAYAWFNLPVLESYPLRWNAAGEANQFGSREDVLILLSIFPFVALGMTLLFALLPRVEPLRGNLEESKKPYGLVWMLCMALILFVATMIALSYATEQGGKIGSSPRLVVTALSLFFIRCRQCPGESASEFYVWHSHPLDTLLGTLLGEDPPNRRASVCGHRGGQPDHRACATDTRLSGLYHIPAAERDSLSGHLLSGVAK
jgi:Domain of unknown function (DUF1648)